mmetsp:Transcript_9461/g.34716  ORF Transcript_9461/g.34716 Transcript_9461/m.34716 type:complete len:224 (+) Transcript_9461:23-694(+)
MPTGDSGTRGAAPHSGTGKRSRGSRGSRSSSRSSGSSRSPYRPPRRRCSRQACTWAPERRALGGGAHPPVLPRHALLVLGAGVVVAAEPGLPIIVITTIIPTLAIVAVRALLPGLHRQQLVHSAAHAHRRAQAAAVGAVHLDGVAQAVHLGDGGGELGHLARGTAVAVEVGQHLDAQALAHGLVRLELHLEHHDVRVLARDLAQLGIQRAARAAPLGIVVYDN